MYKMNHPSIKCQPGVVYLDNPFFSLSQRWIGKFRSSEMPSYFRNEIQINPQLSISVCLLESLQSFRTQALGMCCEQPIYTSDAKRFSSSNFWQQTYTITKSLFYRKEFHGIAIAYLVKLDGFSYDLKCVFFTGRKWCFIYNKFWGTRQCFKEWLLLQFWNYWQTGAFCFLAFECSVHFSKSQCSVSIFVRKREC